MSEIRKASRLAGADEDRTLARRFILGK